MRFLLRENRFEIFSKFHDTLFSEFEESLSGAKHITLKMLHYWEYFAQTFDNPKKVVKKIKKANTIEAYDKAVREILKTEQELSFY